MKTGFDKFFDKQMRNPKFRKGYEKQMKKIKDTSKTFEKVDHEMVAKALGAEIVPTPKDFTTRDMANLLRKRAAQAMKRPETMCVKTGSTWEGVPTLNTMCGRFANSGEKCYKSPSHAIDNHRPPVINKWPHVCPACADAIIAILQNAKPEDNAHIETEEYKAGRIYYDEQQKEARERNEKFLKEYDEKK